MYNIINVKLPITYNRITFINKKNSGKYYSAVLFINQLQAADFNDSCFTRTSR